MQKKEKLQWTVCIIATLLNFAPQFMTFSFNTITLGRIESVEAIASKDIATDEINAYAKGEMDRKYHLMEIKTLDSPCDEIKYSSIAAKYLDESGDVLFETYDNNRDKVTIVFTDKLVMRWNYQTLP